MRPSLAAAVAVAAAAIGAVAAFVLGSAIGFGDDTTTVVAGTEASVSATTVGESRPLNGAFDPAALYAARADGVVTIYANLGADGNAQGSGFVVDRTGAILTNAHVITNVTETDSAVRRAQAVYVEFSDGERVPARIVGWDLFSDVGVIRVEPREHPLEPVPLGNSSGVVVGEPVAAIGSPFGKQTSLSVGVVSATGRSIDSLAGRFTVGNAIQTDASINRGNSGGPLFDAEGRVIGINAQIQTTSGNGEDSVGFAIPIDLAKRALEQLVRTGRVRYAYIGISTQDVTPGIARAFDLGAERGALVTQVEEGTPAADAGLRGGSRVEAYNGLDLTLGGDLIVAIAGRTVRGAEDVSRIVTALLPGQTVEFTVVRGERRVALDVTLGDRPLSSG
jgi:S1-C subfamily serine protease